MNRARFPLSALVLFVASATFAADWPADRARQILDATATIRLAPDLSALSPGERRAVDELLAAGKIMQRLYEDERHPQADAVRRALSAGTAPAANPEW